MNLDESVSGNVPGECKCMCHDEGATMMHIMPCCYPCPTCRLNISAIFLHREHCKGSQDITKRSGITITPENE